MSTGLECCFVERKEGEWFYILENYGSPKGCWDWLDYANAYGPFSSHEAAKTHLHGYHANPGGWFLIDKDHYTKLPKDRMEKYECLMSNPAETVVRGKYWIFWP